MSSIGILFILEKCRPVHQDRGRLLILIKGYNDGGGGGGCSFSFVKLFQLGGGFEGSTASPQKKKQKRI